MTLNTNLIHNLLNAALLIVGVLAVYDWTIFGFTSTEAVKIVGSLTLAASVLKIVINVARDGAGGLVKEQPPVEK